MRPVTLHLGGIKDPAVLAALTEIMRASQETLQNDQSSSGNAMATLTGAAADQIAYFTGPFTTAFTALTAYGRALIGASSASAAGISSPQCGILAPLSTTLLSFAPFNGDRIQIAGTVYAIPSGGIAGLGSTGVFVNSAAGQNLSASTNYYVYAFINSGVVTADFITGGHATDTSAGNVGVEIRAGNNTRTLIGLIRTDGAAHFVDGAGGRLVLSWFNRTFKVSVLSPGNQSTASGSLVALGGTITAINWSGDPVSAVLTAQWASSGTFAFLEVGIDGTTNFGDGQFSYSTAGANGVGVTVGGWDSASEGSHTYGAAGAASSGSGTGTMNNPNLRVTVRG